MGLYINPSYGTKEQWLKEYGTLVCGPDGNPIENIRWALNWHKVFEDEFPVVLIDNGGFKSAAVCYNRAEVERFYDQADPRPMSWYLVPIGRLKEVLSEEDFEHFIKLKGPVDAKKMGVSPGIPEKYL